MIQNLEEGVAAKGFDLVEIVDNKKARKGKSNFTLTHEKAEYHFATQENKNRFIANPERYIPEYGGFCAIAMSEGDLVDANPRSFLIQDDKLFVFFSKYLGIINTRRQWVVDPKAKQVLADTNWDGIIGH